jgi:hypothetical protein
MKEGHSLGSKGRKKRTIITAAFVMALMLLLAACSGSMDDSNGAHAPSRGESTTDGSLSSKQETENTAGTASEDKAIEPAPPSEKGKQGGKRGYANPQQEQQAGQLTAGEWDDLSETIAGVGGASSSSTGWRLW